MDDSTNECVFVFMTCGVNLQIVCGSDNCRFEVGFVHDFVDVVTILVNIELEDDSFYILRGRVLSKIPDDDFVLLITLLVVFLHVPASRLCRRLGVGV